MPDDPKPVPLVPVPEADVAPEKRTVAVQDDRLWGGARQIQGLPGMPTIETKSEYWRQLGAAGLRMSHQQESHPAVPTVEPPPPAPVFAEVRVAPMGMEEAHIYGAVTAVWRRLDLIETVWCEDCFTRGRYDGTRLVVRDDGVAIQCRCGSAAYAPPTGTTDLVLRHLPTIAKVSADTVRGTVTTAAGIIDRPTLVLHDMEAAILRRFIGALRKRHKDPRLFHRGCFSGNVQAEDEALAIGMGPDRLVLVCRCRTLYHQAARVTHAAPLKVM
jgi:hypothetical protein